MTVEVNYLVNLRRLNEFDAEPTFRQRNKIEIYKWCRQNSPLHWDRHVEWIENQAKDKTIDMFAITLDDREKVTCGVCGFTDIDLINRRAEFSLYVFTEFQRRGIARNALKLLLSHGFEVLNLNQIWGEVFEGNPALQLFQDLGFTIDGKLRDFYYKAGCYIDAYRISILRCEYDFRNCR